MDRLVHSLVSAQIILKLVEFSSDTYRFSALRKHNYLISFKFFFFLNPMPHMSLTDFVVFPPGHGRSVTDFSGWDAHEARLRCPDDVSGDIGGCSARTALKPNFY